MKSSILQWVCNFFIPPQDAKMDLRRRHVITAGVAGLGGGLLFHASPAERVDASVTSVRETASNPSLIRPPGSLAEQEFLSKCIRCGECMKACPTNAIQPAMLEGGLQGMWSPVMSMRVGYCDYKCNLCTQVCPTGAIEKLTLEKKRTIRIGLASVDKNRCLPYAYARPCFVCYEHCPLQDKAIWQEDSTAVSAQGEKIAVRLPHVDAAKCIGCGICERKCPVTDEAGIRVTSVGESRDPNNRFTWKDRYSG